MGVCALFLLVLPATAQSQSDADLGAQLTRHLSTMKKDQQVLAFLQNHQWLFSDPRFSAAAKQQMRLHTLSLARTAAEGCGREGSARAPAEGPPARRRTRRRPRERHLPRLR